MKGSPDLPMALDVMGGDHAPAATVAGAIEAIRDLGANLVLVGPEEIVRRELGKHRFSGSPPRVVDAPELSGTRTGCHAHEAFAFNQSLVQGQVVAEDSRYIMIRDSAFNHLAHHRGQLTVYLRLNDIPVPSLYGPTADEKGF